MQERAACVTQKTLDGERAALHKLTRGDLPRVVSTHAPESLLANRSRAYTDAELMRISAHQSEHNAFATRVAREAGLRGAELYTLRRFDERPPSATGKWDERR